MLSPFLASANANIIGKRPIFVRCRSGHKNGVSIGDDDIPVRSDYLTKRNTSFYNLNMKRTLSFKITVFAREGAC